MCFVYLKYKYQGGKAVKEDCFGFSGGQCKLLMQPDCEVCSFYATKEEARRQRERASQMLYEAGLEPCVKRGEDGFIMSTKKIKEGV